ncbi:MAG: hypothetical protein LBT54_00055 [Bifidobacteriaceae bacterium]|nr:hypothetical protein [Bifidobacteriaceae bacterium]
MVGVQNEALLGSSAGVNDPLAAQLAEVAATGIGSLISDALADGAFADLPGLRILQFAPGSVATTILVVMAIAFLAGTLPARRASRQDPIEALRYE